MESLRIPDDAFAGITGYQFDPSYTEVDDLDGGTLRIHHVDVGPADGERILCMHGQPTWSYLYYKMIPLLTAAGYRVIAPDLVGFGKSDKPVGRDNYTYANHVNWMSQWLTKNDFQGLTLVCQDWGGLIGLRLLAAFPERFARAVAANTGLPTGGAGMDMNDQLHALYDSLDVPEMTDVAARFLDNEGAPGFFYWRKYCAENPNFAIRDVMGMNGGLAEDDLKAFDAPFPDGSYLDGARKFPSLVPIFPDDPEIPANKEAWKVLEQFEKPFLTAFSDGDPVTAGGFQIFQDRVPGAKGQTHVTIKGGGHFLQLDSAQDFSDAIITFISDNPA